MKLTVQAGDVLRHYDRAVAADPPSSVREDFERVSRAAPRSAVAAGLAKAFRAQETPQFSEMVSELFTRSDSRQKAGILNRLLASIGPDLLPHLASSGQIPGLRQIVSTSGRVVMPAEAEHVPPEMVRQVAAEAEKRDSSAVRSVSDFYSHHLGLVKSLGAAALTIALIEMAAPRSR